MNVESEPMSRSMKESLHASIHKTRRETFGREKIENLVMNVVSVGAVTDSPKADLLPVQYAMIGVFQSVGGTPANNRAGDIAEISGGLRAGKDVHDDGRVGTDRSASLVVRVDALIACCSDCVARNIALGHDCCINDALENLRCEPRSIQVQVSVFPNFCASHGIDACFHSNLGRTERIVDRANFLLRFEFALRPERIGFRFDSDLHLS